MDLPGRADKTGFFPIQLSHQPCQSWNVTVISIYQIICGMPKTSLLFLKKKCAKTGSFAFLGKKSPFHFLTALLSWLYLGLTPTKDQLPFVEFCTASNATHSRVVDRRRWESCNSLALHIIIIFKSETLLHKNCLKIWSCNYECFCLLISLKIRTRRFTSPDCSDL